MRFIPGCEALETRLVPYVTTGNAWPHPQLITLSFVPDGTNIGGPTSNLFKVFNAKLGSATTWENLFKKAAQQWAQPTNINFSVITDSGAASGSGSYQQGDPAMGDIRIGGYDFGNKTTLASADFPPPGNNYSIAGDIAFNTDSGIAWNNGTNTDVFTVALHELGHALGLGHSASSSAVMYPTYSGVKSGLTSDDISGIQAIYGGPRKPDSYDAAGSNGSFASASNITALINSTSKTALVTNLDITTTSDVDYYKFTAPSGSSSSLKVTVQTSGLSLLAPTVYVYNSAQNQIASVSGSGQYGTTLTLTVSGIKSGSTYYIKVAGADSSAFGTGAYAMTLNLGSGTAPTVTFPNTTTANGSPLTSSGGLALHSGQGDNYTAPAHHAREHSPRPHHHGTIHVTLRKSAQDTLDAYFATLAWGGANATTQAFVGFRRDA
jgi:hypothetical protein